ncbi:MAG: hypothetical protein ACOVOO_03340 [Flavobacteriales bacterium]
MNLSSLQTYIEQKIGFKLDSISSCRKLEFLMKSSGVYVSYTTISRIFGIANISARPRLTTLNELSQFVGYKDYNDFLSKNKQEEKLNQIKAITRLELEALFSKSKTIEAIDYWIRSQQEYPTVFAHNSQFICKQLFDNPKEDSISINYFLSKGNTAKEILQLFVFEDDPYGHYEKALQKLNFVNTDLCDFELFYNLFHARKKILKGKKIKVKPAIISNIQFHLKSRFNEIQILQKALSDKQILEQTNQILNLIQNDPSIDISLAFVGRWCRGLIMTNKYMLLKNHSTWKETCTRLVQTKDYNIEFQAAIFAFLKLTYDISSSLEFMIYGQWQNANIESNFLLSKALKKKEAERIYKDILGYK